MEHNKNNNPKDEIDELLYDYFKNSNEDVPIETSKAIDEALYKKKKHSSFNISKIAAIVLLCFTMTTGLIFAKDIINFFSEIFDLKSTNIDNSGIVDAIANKNYIQNVDMDYIPIDDNYSIKVDYLMLDDLNLYLVFNLHSNKKIDENYRISITDLKLTDQDGNVIYDGDNVTFNTSNQTLYCEGWNQIISNSNDIIRELLYIMTNGISNLKILNFSLNNLIIYNNDNPNKNIEITKNIAFSINIIDKFINKEIYEFQQIQNYKNFDINKCILTDTGMYLLYVTPETNINFAFENYLSTKRFLGYRNNLYYFIIHFNIDKNTFHFEDNIILIETFTKQNIKLQIKKTSTN